MKKLSTAAAILGAKGGSSTSKAKRAAARENGKRGGRPRRIYALISMNSTLLSVGISPLSCVRQHNKLSGAKRHGLPVHLSDIVPLHRANCNELVCIPAVFDEERTGDPADDFEIIDDVAHVSPELK